jgi:hypothetical protein
MTGTKIVRARRGDVNAAGRVLFYARKIAPAAKPIPSSHHDANGIRSRNRDLIVPAKTTRQDNSIQDTSIQDNSINARARTSGTKPVPNA